MNYNNLYTSLHQLPFHWNFSLWCLTQLQTWTASKVFVQSTSLSFILYGVNPPGLNSVWMLGLSDGLGDLTLRNLFSMILRKAWVRGSELLRGLSQCRLWLLWLGSRSGQCLLMGVPPGDLVTHQGQPGVSLYMLDRPCCLWLCDFDFMKLANSNVEIDRFHIQLSRLHCGD